ncbi:hypothetical protein BAY61_24500 [Prauserella marina]|uniref:Uncharacterized protein n=1 Tax=Prauserella marina TaxID=530584 RepID=A0A222VUN4_9PSEU|nr:hypothetical protein [Prauserella marina]ASR37639.1 hypothetical protein BAY61_24500 [Prauserella marina]PWV75559.1 hypothetical protein DES30_106176 [Prauserella marina]SDD31888.1 hypothetical protein SAMN05421630_107264 [Prauserella marina]
MSKNDPKSGFYSTLTPETLLNALKATGEDDETLQRLIATASPDSSLQQLTDAPQATWPTLAAATLFRASLTNLDTYRSGLGNTDEHLGKLLLNAGAIHTDNNATEEPGENVDEARATVKAEAAIAVLNAQHGIPSPQDRLKLVLTLDLEWLLPSAQITAERSNLFAHLLEHQIVPDDAATFAQLHKGGWTAMRPAIAASDGIQTFLTPNLVDGLIADLFGAPQASNKIGPRLLGGLADFLPVNDSKALAAAARFAIKSKTAMPVDQISRIAAGVKDEHLVIRLPLSGTSSSISIARGKRLALLVRAGKSSRSGSTGFRG